MMWGGKEQKKGRGNEHKRKERQKKTTKLMYAVADSVKCLC